MGRGGTAVRFAALFCVLGLLAGCAAPGVARLAPSSYGCMRAVVREKVPAMGEPDKMQHCLAAGFIARYCSRSEAYLASVGKEARDALGFGDAQWSDLVADRVGMGCERGASSDAQVVGCCAARLTRRGLLPASADRSAAKAAAEEAGAPQADVKSAGEAGGHAR